MTSSYCTRQIITFYEKEMFAHTAFLYVQCLLTTPLSATEAYKLVLAGK